MSEDGAPETDWEDYESGPFCVHWSSPGDCNEPCSACGHRCHTWECNTDRCDCKECKDAP